ncbi:MAG: membrane protease YdiL (CAAX protease family) [Oceanicoccus sp.]|jgi:membrane protease YdiL (CAAX protease family)
MVHIEEKFTIKFLVALILACLSFYYVFGMVTALTLEFTVDNLSYVNPVENAPDEIQPRVAIPAAFVMIVSFFMLPAFIVKRKIGDLKLLAFEKFQFHHLVWVLLAPVIFVANFLLIFQIPIFDEKSLFDSTNYSNIAVLPYVLGVVLFSPVVEEWFFRGVIYTLLESKFGSASICAILTTIPWILLHQTMVPEQIVALMCLGYILGLVRHVTGAIYVGVLIHVIYNSLAMLYI